MKVNPYIAPVILLILAGVWIASPRREISTFEEANTALQKQIADALSKGPNIDPTHATPTASAGAAKDKEPLNWKKLIGQFTEMNQKDGAAGKRAIARLEQCVAAMSKEELVAALEDIAARGSLEGFRSTLEGLIMKPLLAKDAEPGLTYYANRVQEKTNTVAWSLSNALAAWAAKDPAKAIAWFDRQLADGKFDSKSLKEEPEQRYLVEGALIRGLLRSAPDAATLRASTMSKDELVQVLSCFTFLASAKEEDQLTLATLIRAQLPEKDRAAVLARPLTIRGAGDGYYAGVNEYMDRITATPAERRVCVEEAAKYKLREITMEEEGITEKSLDALREWAMTQAPDSTDRITGKALAHSLQVHSGDEQKFAKASEWILGYHRASGNDELITSFLGGIIFPQNKDQARALAAQITDPKRREDALNKLK